jgi:hypothetical protein
MKQTKRRAARGARPQRWSGVARERKRRQASIGRSPHPAPERLGDGGSLWRWWAGPTAGAQAQARLAFGASHGRRLAERSRRSARGHAKRARRSGADLLRAQARGRASDPRRALEGAGTLGLPIARVAAAGSCSFSFLFFSFDQISIVSGTSSNQFDILLSFSGTEIWVATRSILEGKTDLEANQSGQPRRGWNFNNQNRSENLNSRSAPISPI